MDGFTGKRRSVDGVDHTVDGVVACSRRGTGNAPLIGLLLPA